VVIAIIAVLIAMLLPDPEQLPLLQSLQFTELMTPPTNTYARTAMLIVQEPEIQTFDLPAFQGMPIGNPSPTPEVACCSETAPCDFVI
jgi:hypothetical protein